MQLHDGAFPSGHSPARRPRPAIAIVLATMFLRRRNQRRLVAVAACSGRCLIGLDRLLLGVHGITDVVAGYALGALWVTARGVRRRPDARGPAVVEPLPDADAPHPPARGDPQPDQGRGRRRRSGRWSTPRAGRARVERADLVRDHDRGPGPLDGPRRRGRGRRAGRGLRWRRHRAHGLRRARRHRHPGRRRARRHRQPAGPQPRPAALPQRRDRRGAERPGPGDRHRADRRRPHRAPTSTSWSWPAWASTPRSWRAPTSSSRRRSAGWPTSSPASAT